MTPISAPGAVNSAFAAIRETYRRVEQRVDDDADVVRVQITVTCEGTRLTVIAERTRDEGEDGVS